MQLKKNIKAGNKKFRLIYCIFLIIIISIDYSYSKNELQGNNTSIKILDKISSKNTSIELINGQELKHKDLLIKSLKCSNSEFDDNPEVIAYLQVKDLTNKTNDDVFVFNDWMFSSSPSIKPFDHPVYDIWLVGCF